jgi:hypothetical protein
MGEYRAFFVRENGHIDGSRAFVCDTDENAIVWAEQLLAISRLNFGAARG